MMRCDCAVAGHNKSLHITTSPPGDPWWAEYVDLYEQMTEFFTIGRDALERVAEWLRKVYISVRDALVSLAERVAAAIEPVADRREPSVLPTVSVGIAMGGAIPDAPPCSSTLRYVSDRVRAPPRGR